MAGDVNYYGKKSKNGMYFYLLNKVVPAMGLVLYKISLRKQYSTKKKNLFSSGFEPETFRVLGGCDNQLHHENTLNLCCFRLFIDKFKQSVLPEIQDLCHALTMY